MAVAPGVLLPPTPDVKPKAAAPKSQQKTPEPSNDKTSSFSDMYAGGDREEARRARRRSLKGSRDKPRDAGKEAAEAQPTDAAEQPAVAEDGKPLADRRPEPKTDGEDKMKRRSIRCNCSASAAPCRCSTENTQATLLPPPVAKRPAVLRQPDRSQQRPDPVVKLNGVPAVNMALERGRPGPAAPDGEGKPEERRSPPGRTSAMPLPA